jgi:hypothetical protein
MSGIIGSGSGTGTVRIHISGLRVHGNLTPGDLARHLGTSERALNGAPGFTPVLSHQ